MPMHVDNMRLVKRVLAGDQSAFDQFFDEHFARLYRFALARLGDDPDSARDVVQNALNKALIKLATYRGEAALFTWLCAICRHEISDHLSARHRRHQHVVLVEDLPEVSGALDSWPAPTRDEPQEFAQWADSVRLIQVALDRLPKHYGDILEWKYVEGYSLREIAARMELGYEATQSLLARARRAFREVYHALYEVAKEHSVCAETPGTQCKN